MTIEHSILSQLLNKKPSIGKQCLLGIVAVCSVAVLCFFCNTYLGFEVVAFILLLTLSIIAMFFDIFPVLVAAIFSALIWDYFFLLPRFNFSVGNVEDQILLSMYFVIAMLNAVLTSKIRKIEKIAQKKEEKIQAIKLYNTILNSLSHEFKTPLAAIIGATDNLLLNPTKLSDTDKEGLLSEISIAALRLNNHVESLLNMSRLESGFLKLRKDWCDMNELISDTAALLEEHLKTHQLTVNIDENIPLFKLDYVFIQQVMYNLLLNACEYTPPNSIINVAVSYTLNNLSITVEDNGLGIPDIEKENVFNKFHRLENTNKTGTGLGLSLVKGFVEAHKGTIDLQNAISGGAKFLITIPIVEILPKNFQNEQ